MNIRLPERVSSRIKLTDPPNGSRVIGPCWTWTGRLQGGGYGELGSDVVRACGGGEVVSALSRQAGQGSARKCAAGLGAARQAWMGSVGHRLARLGSAGSAKRGTVRHGPVGMAWQGRRGTVRQGAAGYGQARRGRHGSAGRGWARLGSAGRQAQKRHWPRCCEHRGQAGKPKSQNEG